MREIKFRGKQPHTGEWIYGNFVKDYDGRCYVTTPLANSHKLVLVTPETIGQYTGLHDENGVEIYEGDIVFIKGEDNKGTIVWNSEELEYGVDVEDVQVKLGCFYGRDLEVIGNIHDQEEAHDEQQTDN